MNAVVEVDMTVAFPRKEVDVTIGGVCIWSQSRMEFLCELVRFAKSGRPAYVCFVTAHMIALAQEDPEVSTAFRFASIRTADGTPVTWAAALLSKQHVPTLDGPSLMPLILKMAEEEGLRVGFLGGRPEVLTRLVKAVRLRHPRIKIVFAASPPFRALARSEDEGLISDINTKNTQLLFVGLGSPKQEKWMFAHRDAVSSTMLGVGAAFEFYIGGKHMPPRWFQALGLTWLYRLLQEPRRLWRRNIVYSPRFVGVALRDIIRRRFPTAM